MTVETSRGDHTLWEERFMPVLDHLHKGSAAAKRSVEQTHFGLHTPLMSARRPIIDSYDAMLIGCSNMLLSFLHSHLDTKAQARLETASDGAITKIIYATVVTTIIACCDNQDKSDFLLKLFFVTSQDREVAKAVIGDAMKIPVGDLARHLASVILELLDQREDLGSLSLVRSITERWRSIRESGGSTPTTHATA